MPFEHAGGGFERHRHLSLFTVAAFGGLPFSYNIAVNEQAMRGVAAIVA